MIIVINITISMFVLNDILFLYIIWIPCWVASLYPIDKVLKQNHLRTTASAYLDLPFALEHFP